MATAKRCYGHNCLVLILLLCFWTASVVSQDCSKANPCATGCCSKFGFCGTGDDHCGPDVCVDTCDFKLGCDEKNPCKDGTCCSKFGFCGLGGDYCAKDLCVANCDSKSECDPGYGAEYAELAECPLSVCCSKWGNCGLTEEFCGNKTVKRPSCSTSGSLGRVVGYYEGWTVQRGCDQFYPEQIPLGIYTHINFAFASIQPKTFEILPADSKDANLYSRLAYLKQQDPDLKIYIAIGGWSFNDPGPTASTFSDLVGSSTSVQGKFFKSLISFLTTHDFDGVDIDWEYPAADDRSGRPEDFINFPVFMARLKSALKTSGRDGVSLTLPASYWYLRHFDIKALAKSVDFFNLMSYDLHGTWDKGNVWTGNFLNAHTNLTEIANALDLIWRNNISPGKVHLGLGFYGRSFSATSSNCLEPGCTFESGGNAGPCSNSVGTLTNSEIKKIMDKKNLTPKLYKDAAVKILTWDNDQWVAFDDADTLKLKADFAKSQCLGGVMVWAITHDTADAMYSQALASVTNRKFIALQQKATGDSVNTVTYVHHQQCRWTNCAEDCPAGFTWMARQDSDHKKDESMTDTTGCDGKSFHKFCCPSSQSLPTCGWYGFNNGRCNGKCPDGTTEIGSNRIYCNNGKYEAACCTIGSDSMALYDTCSWSDWPACDKGKCSGNRGTTLLQSTTGSGAAQCDIRSYNTDGTPFSTGTSLQERRYCCEQSHTDRAWGDCNWYNGYGETPKGRSSNYCLSGCPKDMVRTAMEGNSVTCPKGGFKAHCCLDNYRSEVTIENPVLAEYRAALVDFLNHPTCNNLGSISKRDLISNGITLASISDPPALSTIARRTVSVESKIDSLIVLLLTARAATELFLAEETLWNDLVQSEYPNLSAAALSSFAVKTPMYKSYGPLITAKEIACGLPIWNEAIGSSSTTSLVCSRAHVNATDLGLDGDPDDLSSTTSSVSAYSFSIKRLLNIRLLEERAPTGAPRDFKVDLGLDANGNQISIILQSQPYPNGDNGNTLQNAIGSSQRFALQSPDDCSDTIVTSDADIDDWDWVTEHIMELQTIPRFLEYAVLGTIPQTRLLDAFQGQTASIPVSVILDYFHRDYSTWVPPTAGLSGVPSAMIMEQMGTVRSPEHLVVTDAILNGVKARLWAGNNPMAELTWRTDCLRVDERSAETALSILRMCIAVINYMNNPDINANLGTTFTAIDSQLEDFEDAYNNLPNRPTGSIDMRSSWVEFMNAWVPRMATAAQSWVEDHGAQLRLFWEDIRDNDTNAGNVAIARDTLRMLGRIEMEYTHGMELEIDRQF